MKTTTSFNSSKLKYILITMAVFSIICYAFYEGKLRNIPFRSRIAEQFPTWSIRTRTNKAQTEKIPVIAVADNPYNITGLNEAIQRMLWTVHEMQEFLNYEIGKIRKLSKNSQKISEDQLYRFQELSGEYTNVISNDLEKLDKMLHLKELRTAKWKKVTKAAQSRIAKIQNPKNCSIENKMCCSLNIGDGLAAEMNMLLPCQVKSFYSGKMLQLRTSPWPYIQGSTWENYFQPYSNNCQNETFIQQCDLTYDFGSDKEAMISLPEEMAEDLRFLGLNPLAWFYGQFNGYILRPSARMLEVIRKAKRKLGFTRPIVALQVRKTDKIGNEAIDHPVEDYMIRADRYFNKLQLESKTTIKRKIFVATDDPNVTLELRQKYPNHTFLNNPSASEAAKSRDTRYSLSALEDLIVDIYLLASSDRIVCTFSSGVCRLAFELMQYLQPDCLLGADSLDVGHHFVFAVEPKELVFYDHSPLAQNEIVLRRGDLIERIFGAPRSLATEGRLYNGMSYGDNTRTKNVGFIPTFKVFPVLLNRPYEVNGTSWRSL